MDRRIYLLLGALCVLALLLFGGCEDGVLDSPESRVGKDWRVVELDRYYDFIGIMASEGVFIGKRRFPSFYRSNDGVTWEYILNNYQELFDTEHIEHAGEFFFATLRRHSDGSPMILRSTDGVTWKRSSALPVVYDSLIFAIPEMLVQRSGEYLAIYPTGDVAVSSDGLSWRETPGRKGTFLDSLQTLRSDGGRVIAFGHYQDVPTIAAMDEDYRWTHHRLDFTDRHYTYDVIWTGDQYIAVGCIHRSGLYYGCTFTSYDGDHWEIRMVANTPYLKRISRSPCGFIAVGGKGTIMTSPDGVVWTLRASGTEAPLHSVACTKDHAVAVGYYNTVLVSP